MIYKRYFTNIPILLKILILIVVPLVLSGKSLAGQEGDFNAQVIERKHFNEIPSASGIEFLNGKFYIIGDDSPFVFELDENFNLIRKLKITDENYANNGRIPKDIKPDYEAIVTTNWGKDIDLILFGSGSSVIRNKALRIDFDNIDYKVKVYDLAKLYEDLSDKADLDNTEFNIEGAASWNNNLILLNRGSNHLFIIPWKRFKNFARDDKSKFNTEIKRYILPSIQGNNAGFSGGYVVEEENLLIFTASIENTPDWINDGEILGSYIGLIDLKELNNPNPVCLPVSEKGKRITDKIESVYVKSITLNSIVLYAVTDNDNGVSDLLLIEINK